MNIITTFTAPDKVPEIPDEDSRYPDHQMIGQDAFAIQTTWFPRDYEGLPGSWDRYSQMIPHMVQEILGGEFTAGQLQPDDISPSHLVPTDEQLKTAIRAYCEEANGWVKMSDALVERGLKVYREVGLGFAADFIQTPHIVIQQSPPDLRSLSQLLSKSKELTTPLAGMWIGMHAAAGVSNPLIYLLCVSGGIILCGSSLAFARELDKLIKAFIKKMQRHICPP